jgi:RNA polymerase-binding transcription factor DksA
MTKRAKVQPGQEGNVLRAKKVRAPLTANQRRHLEARLREERRRVVQALETYHQETRATIREDAGDVPGLPEHLAEVGSQTAHLEFDAANAARMTAELAEIDAALARLYETPDEFGRCERTGRPIPFKRLDVVPWARTSE